jgi:phenylacetate-CoA ligase
MSLSLEDRLHGVLSRYIAAPQWLKSTLGVAYRHLPLVLRRGQAYMHFQDMLTQRDPETVAAYARVRLAETLRWATETVPAYAHLRTVAAEETDPCRALRYFPLTSKADIKAEMARYLSSAMPAEKRLRTFTGGSTAEPMQFYLEKDVSRPREYAFMDDFHDRVGYREGKDLVLALRGRTVPTAAKPGGRLWMHEPVKHQLILSSDHLLARWMPQYLEALRKWRPRFIQAFPSALYPLARWLAENPAPDITGDIQGVMLYSENAYDFQMRLFQEVFGCPVLKHYGHSERVLMAATLPDDERYFFWPQYGHVELADPNGQPITVPGVLGEIVGTSFDNRVMPFIRYRTGDLAMWSAAPPPPSQAAYPVVERIEGRLQEFAVCHDGRLVSICTLGAAHFEELAGVDAIQYSQTQPGRVELHVVCTRTLDTAEKSRIARAIEEKTQHGCQAEVIQVSQIDRTARGKHLMLKQALDVSQYIGAAGGEA